MFSIAVAFIAAAGSIAAVAPASYAESTASAPDSQSVADFAEAVGGEFLKNQATLGELSGWIQQQPDLRTSGYVGLVFDSPNLATRLLWKGEDKLLEAALEKAADLGIQATVEQRPHNLAEIEEIADRLLAADDQFAALGYQVEAVAGVSAESPDVALEGHFASAARTFGNQAESEVAALAADIAGAQVQVNADTSVEATGGTRQSATSPFYAGGMMVSGSTTGMICSSGFAVNYGGSARATTSRHCEPPTGSWRSPDNSANYGAHVVNTPDAAMKILTGAGAPRVFDGAYNNASGYNKNVYALYDVGLNAKVCTSGGNSGVHCNIKVTNMAYFFNDGYGSLSHIEGTQETSGQMAVSKGDSGGPVFAIYAPPYTNTTGAVGIIQAGVSNLFDEQPPCTNMRYDTPCTKRVLFTSVRAALNSLPGTSLVTGPAVPD